MAPAILRETSGGTSYQIARLVFRPYGQLRRTICTSVPLRTSTRVSPGLVLAVRSSRSFGSQRARSCSNLSKKSRSADSAEPKKPITDFLFLLLPCSLSRRLGTSLSLCVWGFAPLDACARVGLLGPCFKTGHSGPLGRHR